MKIVILPGLDGTGTLLSDCEALLARDHGVLILRYPSELCRYDDLQAWVEDRLPEEDFVIVAESFSGPLAVMIAAEQPIGLKGIVFVATFAKAPRRLPSFLTRAVSFLPLKSRVMIWLAQPFPLGRWSDPTHTEAFRQAMHLVPGSTIAKRLREVVKVDVTQNLGRLEIPFIYLLATKDRLVPARMALDFKHRPDAIVPLEGPHFLLQANATRSAQAILSFIRILT